MKFKFKKAFTMAELMICLLIISFLATILLPAIMQNRPNRSKVMFRKAYYITERVISELINDEDLYPNDDELGTTGFASVKNYVDNDDNKQGATKFCYLFFEKVNTAAAAPVCTASRSIPSATPSEATEGTFITNDGIIWYMPASVVFSSVDSDGFVYDTDPTCPEGDTCDPVKVGTKLDADGSSTTCYVLDTDPDCVAVTGDPTARIQQIRVDVNGVTGPNCFYTAEICENPDRFEVSVRFDGKILVDGFKEREYLLSNSTLR